MGVSYFSDYAPGDFGAFDAAVVALFRVTAGDSWIESLPPHAEDGAVQAARAHTRAQVRVRTPASMHAQMPTPTPVRPHTHADGGQ